MWLQEHVALSHLMLQAILLALVSVNGHNLFAGEEPEALRPEVGMSGCMFHCTSW